MKKDALIVYFVHFDNQKTLALCNMYNVIASIFPLNQHIRIQF